MRKIFLIVIALSLALGNCFAADKKNKADQQTSSGVRLINPHGMAKPLSTYSQVAEVTGGKIVFIAGQVGIGADGKLVGNDFKAQVEQAFKNIKSAVEATGGTMSSLVKTNYYVAESVDAKEIPALREIRDRYIDTKAPPTSTFVVVKRLANPDYLVEIEAVAAVK
jgi:enamine deaminase RidA (YjgF/YER057c/UK114 family)